MKDTHQMILTTCMVVTFIAVAAASFVPVPSAWGFNHLSYFPAGVGVVLWLVAAACVLPVVRRRLARLVNPALEAAVTPGRNTFAVQLGLASLFTVLCLVFKSAVHFWGDTEMMASVVDLAVSGHESIADRVHYAVSKVPRAPGAIFIHAVVGHAGAKMGLSARAAVAVWHALVGGVYFFITLRLIMGLELDAASKLWMAVLLYTSGAVALFFGYTEVYALPYLFMTVVALLSYRYARDGEGSLVLIAVLTAVAIVLNVQAALLLPLSCFLLITRLVPGRRVSSRAAVSVIAATIIISVALRFVPALSKHFRPWVGDVEGGAVFSFTHLYSIANELALLIPAFLVVLAVMILGRPRAGAKESRAEDSSHRYLPAVAATPFVLFIFLFKPDLGLWRDWDLFASITPFLILLSVPAALKVSKEIKTWIVPILLVGLLQTGAWVSILADVGRSEARYKQSLAHDLSHGGYGYEVLAEYYKDHGRDEEALEAIQSALRTDGNPRYAFNAGVLAAKLGRMDEAIEAMRKCLLNDPDNIKASVNLTSYLIGKRDFPGVIDAAREGLKYEPDNAYLNVFLGMALLETRQYEAAYTQLRHSLRLNLPPEMRNDVARAVSMLEQSGLSPPDE